MTDPREVARQMIAERKREIDALEEFLRRSEAPKLTEEEREKARKERELFFSVMEGNIIELKEGEDG
jgi:hypothetical protein